MKKECFKCGAEKSLSEFYKHSEMKDGHLGKCMECTKTDVRLYYQENTNRCKLYEKSRNKKPHRVEMRKRYRLTENGKAKYKKAHAAWAERNPHKVKARNMVSNAVRDGKLIKWPCVKCGNKVSQAHHPDYSKPLDVIWLCRKHHMEEHWG